MQWHRLILNACFGGKFCLSENHSIQFSCESGSYTFWGSVASWQRRCIRIRQVDRIRPLGIMSMAEMVDGMFQPSLIPTTWNTFNNYLSHGSTVLHTGASACQCLFEWDFWLILTSTYRYATLNLDPGLKNIPSWNLCNLWHIGRGSRHYSHFGKAFWLKQCVACRERIPPLNYCSGVAACPCSVTGQLSIVTGCLVGTDIWTPTMELSDRWCRQGVCSSQLTPSVWHSPAMWYHTIVCKGVPSFLPVHASICISVLFSNGVLRVMERNSSFISPFQGLFSSGFFISAMFACACQLIWVCGLCWAQAHRRTTKQPWL